MTFKKLLITASLAASPVLLLAQGQGLDPAKLLKPLSDEWPPYNGDYSGKRSSLLKQIKYPVSPKTAQPRKAAKPIPLLYPRLTLNRASSKQQLL